MAKFQFKLQSLQRYREQQRDVCRQILASVLAEDGQLVQRREELTTTRESIVAEIQQMQSDHRLNIDQVVTRRFHAAQLLAQVREVDSQREVLALTLQQCRQALARADQGVKVLEQLADKQKLEFQQMMEAKESKEREELWQSGQLRVDWK